MMGCAHLLAPPTRRPRRYTRRVRIPVVAIVAAFASLLCANASAQWINYPTRDPAHGRWQAQPLRACAQNSRREAGSLRCLGALEFAHHAPIIWMGSTFRGNRGRRRCSTRTPLTIRLNNPESHCLPRGTPKADAFDLHKIVQTPELIVILYEYQTTYRQIFLDGRALPKDPNPTWGGLLDWTLGGRHAGGGIEWLQWEGLAFRARQSDQRCACI